MQRPEGESTALFGQHHTIGLRMQLANGEIEKLRSMTAGIGVKMISDWFLHQQSGFDIAASRFLCFFATFLIGPC